MGPLLCYLIQIRQIIVCTYHNLLTGKNLFTGWNLIKLMFQILFCGQIVVYTKHNLPDLDETTSYCLLQKEGETHILGREESKSSTCGWVTRANSSHSKSQFAMMCEAQHCVDAQLLYETIQRGRILDWQGGIAKWGKWSLPLPLRHQSRKEREHEGCELLWIALEFGKRIVCDVARGMAPPKDCFPPRFSKPKPWLNPIYKRRLSQCIWFFTKAIFRIKYFICWKLDP